MRTATNRKQLPSDISEAHRQSILIRRARERAKEKPCSVLETEAGSRVYKVTNADNRTYTVRFTFDGGLRYGRCTCPAGVAGVPCYHLIHATDRDDASHPRCIA